MPNSDLSLLGCKRACLHSVHIDYCGLALALVYSISTLNISVKIPTLRVALNILCTLNRASLLQLCASSVPHKVPCHGVYSLMLSLRSSMVFNFLLFIQEFQNSEIEIQKSSIIKEGVIHYISLIFIKSQCLNIVSQE